MFIELATQPAISYCLFFNLLQNDNGTHCSKHVSLVIVDFGVYS